MKIPSPDALLLRGHQKIADLAMDRWQLSCFWLAGQLAVPHGAFGTIFSAVALLRMKSGVDIYLSGILTIYFLINSMALYRQSQEHERAWLARSALMPYRGPSTSFLVSVTVFFVFIDILVAMLRGSLPDFGTLFFDLAYVTWTSAAYFLNCVPRPPRRQTAKAPVGATFQAAA